MHIRLQKILSAAGVASRRAAEKLIVGGRVSVNGETITQLGTRADPDGDDIRVDGRRIGRPKRRYIALHKPRGYVTTRADPEHRKTVLDLIGPREYLYPVGRLDYDLPEGHPEPRLPLRALWTERGGHLLGTRGAHERLPETAVRGADGEGVVQHGGGQENRRAGVCLQEEHQ